MLPQSVLSQVGLSDTPSLGQDLLRQFLGGDLTEKDYLVQNALQVAGNISEWYSPRPYFPMNSYIQSYIQRRLAGSEYDLDLAFRMGGWLKEVYAAKNENDSDVSHLVWCVEQLLLASLEAQAERVGSRVVIYQNMKFPYKEFEDALKVKKIDSQEKQRKS